MKVLAGGGKVGKIRRFIQENRGQAIVEMALILPILLMLVFGMIDFGRVINAYQVATEASREGARQYAVEKNSVKAEAKMKSVANSAASIDLGTISAKIYNNDPAVGSVRAKVTYNVKILTPGVNTMLGSTVAVIGQTVMRVE